MDFSKVREITVPDGDEFKSVKSIQDNNGRLLWKYYAQNWIKQAVEKNSINIYNGGLGYKLGYRLNSSAEEVAADNAVVTGYIPVKPGDTISVKGILWGASSKDMNYCWYYNSSFTAIKCERYPDNTQDIDSTFKENGEATFIIASYAECAYIRISGVARLGLNIIITINESVEDAKVIYNCTNHVKRSIANDFSIYNGCGYKNGYRISSDGTEKELDRSAATGYIKVSPGDTVRIGGGQFIGASTHGSALAAYDSSFNLLGQFSMLSGTYGIFKTDAACADYAPGQTKGPVEEASAIAKWTVPTQVTNIAYIRVSSDLYQSFAADGSLLVITINEQIA